MHKTCILILQKLFRIFMWKKALHCEERLFMQNRAVNGAFTKGV